MPTELVTQYKIELKVGGRDLTTFVQKIHIVNSIFNCWPVIDLVFDIDNQEFITYDIYGQKEFNLKLWVLDYAGAPFDPPVEFRLVYLMSELDLPEKPEDNMTKQKDYQRRPTTIRFIPYPALNVMTSFINKVWEEPTGRIPLDFVKEILDMRGYRKDAIIEDAGMNDYKVDQLLIPPMSIKRAVDLIDEKFSIFKGPTFRYCNYAGHFLLWDLFEHYQLHKNDPRIIFYKLSSDYKSPDKFWELQKEAFPNDPGRSYVGYDTCESLHYGNSSVIEHGFKYIYITHPHEDLYFFIKRDLPEIVTEKGIWHDTDKVKYFDDLKSRKVYITDFVGHENDGYSGDYNESPITNKLAAKLRDTSSVRFNLRRRIFLRYVMQVGEVAYIDPSCLHEIYETSDYSGGYIIGVSDIWLDKSPSGDGGDQFDAVATITAFRSTQSRK